MVALNKSTQILINNFIDTHFSGENKAQIKQEALEIADLIAERSENNLDRFATKEDLLNVRSELKEEIAGVRSEILATKYELLKWLVGSQVAVAGLIIAVLKFT